MGKLEFGGESGESSELSFLRGSESTMFTSGIRRIDDFRDPPERPQHITTVYHYTSAANWEKIRGEGLLQPKTSPISLGLICSFPDLPDENPELRSYWKKKHIVGGVDSADFESWRETGLHDRLLEYTSQDDRLLRSTRYETREIVELSFPAAIVNGAFIREHGHTTPKRQRELGIDPDVDAWRLSIAERDILNTQSALDYRSVVRASLYDGSFEVPEIWIPHPISIKDITVVKSGRIEDFKSA